MNAYLPMLQFLRPWWLLALFALPLLAWAWRARQRQRSAWRDVVDPHLLPHLLEDGGGRGARAPWLALVALALAILALAGPSWRQREQPLWQTRAPLVVAIDLSGSVLANDLPPSRLLQARAKVAELLKQRAGGQVGLVAYASDAYTVAPLTDDTANVALFLDALAPDVMPEFGSAADSGNAANAIAQSQRLLEQAGFSAGDILLLTNAADGEAKAEAANAARAGYRVSVLGLGTATGAAWRRGDGSIGQTALDAASLQALASAGDGRYATLETGDGDLRALGVLDPQRAGAMAAQGEKAAIGIDEGYWLLPPLLLLALLLFRRGGAFAALFAVAFLLPALPAQAADGTLWKRADQQEHARMQRGAEAYHKGDFAGAAQTYAGMSGAEGQYNYGNALAKQGEYEQAIAAYDRALRRQPGMADAVANRKAVEDAMKRKPPQGGKQQQQQNQNQKPGQQGQPNQDGQGKPQSQQDPQKQRNQQQGQQPTTNKQQPEPQQAQKPGDAEAQQRADAAQRQQMQQALQRKGQAGQPDSPTRERPETEAERERRIASEAWLRRVPDDPGGLLRAKFRLEYERRHGQGGD